MEMIAGTLITISTTARWLSGVSGRIWMDGGLWLQDDTAVSYVAFHRGCARSSTLPTSSVSQPTLVSVSMRTLTTMSALWFY